MTTISEIEKDLLKKKIPQFRPGDTVDVHIRLTETDRERIQLFSGVVIARKHGGIRETFTVRRIVQGEGVERIFPLHSPHLVDVAVKIRGYTRRAKLYYLRKRIGKATRLEGETERIVATPPEVPPPVETAPEPQVP